MRKLISLFLFCCFLGASAQPSPTKGFKSLSGPEKWWVIWHPFVAKKAYKVSLEARSVSKEMLADSSLDGDNNGGQVDAFRHSYWMARLSQEICWRKARSLGRAHEKGNYKAYKKGRTEEGTLPDSIAGAMDLFNNEIGLQLGRQSPEMPPDALKIAVRDSVITGRMQVILKDAAGQALDCQHQLIDTFLYKGQWNIPKCLMPSNYRK